MQRLKRDLPVAVEVRGRQRRRERESAEEEAVEGDSEAAEEGREAAEGEADRDKSGLPVAAATLLGVACEILCGQEHLSTESLIRVRGAGAVPSAFGATGLVAR